MRWPGDQDDIKLGLGVFLQVLDERSEFYRVRIAQLILGFFHERFALFFAYQPVQTFLRLRDQAIGHCRKRVHVNGFFVLAPLFINLAEVVANLAVLPQEPRRGDVFFRHINVAFLEMNPTERVPVGGNG